METPEEDRVIELKVEVLETLWTRLKDLFRRRGWDEADGLRMVLAAGLASLEADEKLADASSVSDIQGLLRELARLDSEYSVMKYRAFKLAETNRILQMKISGLKASEETWRRWAEKIRDELSRLKPDGTST